MQRCFFIHLPKTGGVSFTSLLKGIYPAGDICPADHEEQCIPSALDLNAYRLYCGHLSYFLTSALPGDTQVITFLRHPVVRAMSTYEHILTRKTHPRHGLLITQTKSLADFVRHPLLGQQVCNLQTRALGRSLDFGALRAVAAIGPDYVIKCAAFIEVFRTLAVTSGELAEAKQRLARMPFFGLTERFEESCHRFLNLLDRPMVAIAKANQTPEEVVARRGQYSQEDVRAVTEANQLDLQLYEFALKRFDQAR